MKKKNIIELLKILIISLILIFGMNYVLAWTGPTADELKNLTEPISNNFPLNISGGEQGKGPLPNTVTGSLLNINGISSANGLAVWNNMMLVAGKLKIDSLKGTGTRTACLDNVGNVLTCSSFPLSSFTVLATAGAKGTITPASQTVNSGSTTTFTVSPNSGYRIASITGTSGTGCDTGSLSGTTYTTGPITTNCVVNVTFSAISGYGTMAGYLYGYGCYAQPGTSGCNVYLSWFTNNPIATSSVTTPTNITLANGNSGGVLYPISYPSRNFFLYNNGQQLSSITSRVYCGGFNPWDGAKCVNVYPLTAGIVGSGSGTITPSTGALSSYQEGVNSVKYYTGYYSPGVSVTLTATPDTGKTFLGWSGACTNTTGTCTVVLNGPKMVVARFKN